MFMLVISFSFLISSPFLTDVVWTSENITSPIRHKNIFEVNVKLFIWSTLHKDQRPTLIHTLTHTNCTLTFDHLLARITLNVLKSVFDRFYSICKNMLKTLDIYTLPFLPFHTSVFGKKVLNVNQGCIYLIKETIKQFEIWIFCNSINIFTVTFFVNLIHPCWIEICIS